MLQRIRRVLDYIDGNLNARLTVAELAREGGISRSHFCFLFKTETGLAPLQYVKLRRIERARELLETTDMSETDIRSRVGFPDRSHFAREYKKIYGVTPKKQKRMLVRANINRQKVG